MLRPVLWYAGNESQRLELVFEEEEARRSLDVKVALRHWSLPAVSPEELHDVLVLGLRELV